MDIPCDKFKEKGNTNKKTRGFFFMRQNRGKNQSTKTMTQNSDPLNQNTEEPGALTISSTYRLGPDQITSNDGLGNIQYESPLQEPIDRPGVDDADVHIHIPNAVAVESDERNNGDLHNNLTEGKVFQSLKRMALVGLLLTFSIIAAVVAVSVLLTRPVTSPVETLPSSLSPNLSLILPETPIFNPTSSPSTGLFGSTVENPFGNGTVSDEPSAPPSKATLSPEPSVLPSITTMSDKPPALPSQATITDESSAKPSITIMSDEPSAKPLVAPVTDEPTAKPSVATVTDEPTAQPSVATVTDEPTAKPSVASCIVSSSTEARVCLLFDVSYYYFLYYGGIIVENAEGLVDAINKFSPESLYSIVTFSAVSSPGYSNQFANDTIIAIKNLRFENIPRAAHLGIAQCQESFSGKENSHVIILFSNGLSDNSTLTEIAANAAKKENTKIVCIKLGSITDLNERDNLESWASSNELVITSGAFDNGIPNSDFITKSFCT